MLTRRERTFRENDTAEDRKPQRGTKPYSLRSSNLSRCEIPQLQPSPPPDAGGIPAGSQAVKGAPATAPLVRRDRHSHSTPHPGRMPAVPSWLPTRFPQNGDGLEVSRLPRRAGNPAMTRESKHASVRRTHTVLRGIRERRAGVFRALEVRHMIPSLAE